MQHLVSIGWPNLVLAALLFLAAVPAVVAWAVFEVRLARRARAIRPRARESWPYW
jgi:hypothetical protein